MHTPATDTRPEAERFMIEAYRRMSAAQKIRRIFELNRALEQLQLARLRARFGAMSPREQRLRLGALRLPRALMIEAFGWDPEERGL